MKEEALKLADELDKYKGIITRDAAKMLRQQHSEIVELIKHMEFAGIVVERKAQEK